MQFLYSLDFIFPIICGYTHSPNAALIGTAPLKSTSNQVSLSFLNKLRAKSDIASQPFIFKKVNTITCTKVT